MAFRYKMDSNPHGVCIIINNYFTDGESREGTGKDRNELKSLFKSLKYDVKVEENKTACEMLYLLKEQNINPNNKIYDSFICCFLSHGDELSIHGNNNEGSLLYTAIWSLFGEESSTLRNKPKIFIAQSCQKPVTSRLNVTDKRTGNIKTVSSTDIDNINDNPFDSSGNHAVQEAKIEFDQGLKTLHSDILFIKSSVPGSRAVRSRSGSPFIKTFCEVVRNNYRTHSLMEMVQIMINDIRKKSQVFRGIKMTVPSFQGSIRKKIYFNYGGEASAVWNEDDYSGNMEGVEFDYGGEASAVWNEDDYSGNMEGVEFDHQGVVSTVYDEKVCGENIEDERLAAIPSQVLEDRACTGFILDVGVDNAYFYPIIIKFHPAFSLSVRVDHPRKGLQEDFRSMMKRNIAVKLKDLIFNSDVYFNKSSSYEESTVSFSKEETKYLNFSEIIKVPYFQLNVKGKFRWTSEIYEVYVPKYKEYRRKRDALLTSDTEIKCVIWEATIRDIHKILAGRRESFILLTNMKQVEYKELKFESTTETLTSVPSEER